MSQFTHEIKVPGTSFCAYVNADRLDLDKYVMRIWGRTATARKRTPAPIVRRLDPAEAVALPSTAQRYADARRRAAS